MISNSNFYSNTISRKCLLLCMFKSSSFGTKNTLLMVINRFLTENMIFVLNCVYLQNTPKTQ